MKNKKSTMKKSILEIVPIREITENGYFRMDDGKVMELLQIQTKDVINTSADEIEYDCIKYAKFYRLYSDDLKIISLNYPCDYGQQKRFLEYKISTTKNSIYKKRPASQAATLKNGQKTFLAITNLKEKAQVINNIITMFRCDATTTTNLKTIGGSANAGGM